jgi:hypothetical protein
MSMPPSADPSRQSARARRDVALPPDIERVWDAKHQVYGGRKVWRQLRREAIAAPCCQVARLKPSSTPLPLSSCYADYLVNKSIRDGL